MANVTATDDDSESKQLPDCIQSENGLMLTDLGRMQVRIFYRCVGKYKNLIQCMCLLIGYSVLRRFLNVRIESELQNCLIWC